MPRQSLLSKPERNRHRRRINRSKTGSSLQGFFPEDSSIDEERYTTQSEPFEVSQSDKEELTDLARKLRRTKRKLLLQAVEQQETDDSVDRLRNLLLRVSLHSSTSSGSVRSFSSFPDENSCAGSTFSRTAIPSESMARRSFSTAT